MRRQYITLAVVAVVLALAIWMNLPSNPGIYVGSFQNTMQLVYGLDLRGGAQVLLEADVADPSTIDPQSMQDALRILESRTNGLGVSETQFQIAGGNRIVGEFPGLKDPAAVLATVKNTGLLEFVDLGSNPDNLGEGAIIKTNLGGSSVQTAPTPTVAPTATSTGPTATPDAAATPVAPEKIWNTIMVGKDLKTVTVQNNGTGGYELAFTLSSDGANIFADFTAKNIGKTLAIVLDKKIISAPSINGAIPSGSGVIQGSFTNDEANNLAVQMRYGALPFAFKIVESRLIGPTLGQDSLNKSLLAGLIGFLIVILFMAIYYRLPGLMASVSIVIYALVMLACFRLIPVVLTLPGIAGFLLGTGSALDANILIFERFKEELRAGRTFFQAIDLGWRRAWPSIRDSNIATLLTCFILFMFGNSVGASIVKGFAVNLALGVVVSLLCAFFVTLTLLHVLVDVMKPQAKHFKLFGILD
jgi:preprotein translocase subunit SecD